MKKIISLFQRNYETDRLVRDEVVPGAEWVLAGEGRATRKWDGTCCMVRGGKLYKRYELKKGKTAPEGFEAAQDADKITDDVPGWVPVGDEPNDVWYREAIEQNGMPEDGTYELVGPKVQGNPEKLIHHHLYRHGDLTIDDAPRSFAELKSWLAEKDIEGIVWHHPDGRMVKIKKKDFGMKRITPQKETPR